MLRLDLTKDAADFWGGLDAKQYRPIGRKLLGLMEDPLPPDSALLRGSEHRRADIGEYRIIYRFDHATLYVAKVGRRDDGEVYR